MAIRTSSSASRSSSYSKPSVPKKPSSASRPSSVSRTSTPTQSKPTQSTPKRDTFTYSSPTAKQTAPKTSTAKTSTASKSSQAKTSTTKTNAPVRTSSTKTVTKAKSNPTASKAKRDSFEFSSEAVKKSVQSAKSSKSSANGKTTTKNNTKNSANAQTKKTVKNNSSNKNTVSGSASKSNKSSKNKVPDGLNQHLKHTKDPKQKTGMQKTINDIENSSSSEKADKISKKLKELGIDLSAMDMRNGAVAEITDAQAYTVVADNDMRADKSGFMTQSTYNKILKWMTHESGDTGTDRFGVASVILNEVDLDGISHGAQANTLTDAVDKAIAANQQWVRNGDILGVDVSNDINGTLEKKCKEVLDFALTGNRAFSQDVIYFARGSNTDKDARVSASHFSK